MTRETAEKLLREMLAAAGLPVRGSYRPGEVCAILGIGDRTFWSLIQRYERDERGALRRPDCLDSFMLSSNRRVTYAELTDYLCRNQTWQRQNAIHPDQMHLFD
ncbi:DNA-binding protein [Geobacter sp.]|uniref:DNA-binding protein n=1 Tax=Geobacter sp. TaxID=46610 RepID=UPI00261A70CF|nr:DNA-binding protein [Geobacter sp.]